MGLAFRCFICWWGSFLRTFKAGNRTKFPKYLTQPKKPPDVPFLRSNCDQCPGTLVESVLVELVPEHTAFGKQLGEVPWSLKEHQLMMGWGENSLYVVWQNQNEGTELVPLINCELGMMSNATHLSFFSNSNTNCKFIFSCLGIEFLFLASNVVLRTMCSYKENKVFVVFHKICHSWYHCLVLEFLKIEWQWGKIYVIYARQTTKGSY